ncbi:beta strand repeat-containing protein, partial [Psychromonas sp. Urea-02u-13]|uniref:beta strand repeat-containing protein n=1 Tax=Psychromonas sp. Urea-02u-13 TaxID=2058326 RepID=UPI000CBCDADF
MKSLLPFFTARFTLAKKTNIQVVSTSLMGEFHHQLIQHVPKTYHKSRLSRLAFSRPALSVCIALAGFSLPSLFTPALAAPTGGDIVGGTGTISKDDLATIIKQTSQNIAIDWDSYNIDATEVVKYIQPNGQSIALNRILGVNGSTIAGKIESNGQVILINPNGLVFTDTSVLNVGGIIASGLNMNTSDFMNGDYIFDEVVGTEGTVINRGIINASLGGLVVEGHGVGGNVALIGKQVINEGLIEAHLGSVTLAAGKQAVLTFDSSGVLGVRVSKEILQEELGIDPAVVNSGEINAAGGRVLLTASTSQDIFSQAVNAGIDEATSAVVHADGSFTLGGGSDVLNSGLVDVSTGDYSQTAGQIVLIGENVTSSGELRADSTVGDAGSIELNSRDKTLLTDNSMTSAQGLNSGKGGEIKVLGGSVGLFDQSVVDVSGVEGGGQVLIGGDYRGENIQVTNASGTFVAKDVVINADAISAGDGGEVIIWADKSAKVYGTINAKGGVQSGDGGFVETSAEFVDLDLQVNVSALNGESGEWLIDPYNITISNSSASNVNDKWQGSEHIFTNDGGNSNVTLESLYSALWDGAYVTVETSGGNSDGASEPTGGNITLVDSFDMDLKAGGGSATLELLAHHDININANIYDSDTTDSQKLNIILNANSNYLSGDGSVNPDHLGGDVNINADIFTYGGSFSASGDNITILSTKQINTTGKKNTAGGNISLTANNGFISTGALTSNAGTAFNAEGKEAGDISLFATANITVDGIMSAVGADGEQKSDSKGKAGGNAGDITIQTEIGTVDIKNEINNSGGNADGASNRLSDSANGGQSGLITIGAKDGFTIDTVKLNTITSNGGKAFGNTGAGGAAQAITVTANSIELAGDIENKGGALDANGSASTLGAGGDVIFNGAVTLKNAAISINTTGSIGGDIRFKSTLNGTQNLTLTGKDIQFTGEVGNASPLSDLIVTATGGIQANGGINANSIDLQGATTVTTGALTATNIIDVAASEITVGALNANSIKLQGATTVTTGALTATTTIDVSGSDISVGTLNTTNNTINLTATDNSDGGTATITLNGDIISGTGVVAVNVDGALNADALITINHSGDFTSSNITLTGAETGTSKLQASSAQANTWDITNLGNTVAGLTFLGFTELVAGSEGDTFNIGATVGNLTGGTGSDTFVLKTDGNVTGIIDGVSGDDDKLVGWNSSTNTNSWTVDTTNTVTNTVNSVIFSNIDVLQGGDGKDEFTVNASIKDVLGGEGDDVFDIKSTSLVTGSIDGGNGTNDVLNLMTAGQTLDLSTLSNIEAVTAQSTGAANTLQAGNASSNTWNVLTTANSGQVGSISFSNFANLVAGSGGDIFNIDAAIGNLMGGDEVDTFNISATTVSISAGDNDDIINVDATSLITGSIDGGNGTNDVLNLMT